MVGSVDDSMKMVMDALEELEIDDRTVILFTSDNGGLDRNSNRPITRHFEAAKGMPTKVAFVSRFWCDGRATRLKALSAICQLPQWTFSQHFLKWQESIFQVTVKSMACL